MAWDNLKKNLPPSEGGELLKLEEGSPVKIRIVGEPYVFDSEYQGKLNTRFAIKLWNQIANKAQFLMIPKTPLNAILELAESEDWGDPTDYDITIKKTGTGLDTFYTVQPSPNKSKLNEKKQELVDAIDLEEALKKFPSVQFVMPLSDTNEEFWQKKESQKPVKEPLPNPPDEIAEVNDEPINLDDIPF